MSNLDLNGHEEIVVTKHADSRLQERANGLDLDLARDEIQAAYAAGRVTHIASNIFYAEAEDGDRVYRIAAKPGRLVVMTVVRPHVCRTCGGGREARGLVCRPCRGTGRRAER